MKVRIFALTLAATALFAAALPAADAAVEPGDVRAREAELEELRGALKALRDDLQTDLRKRDEQAASLRDAEKREAAAAKRLQGIRSEQKSNEAQRRKLQGERRKREGELAEERDALAEQLRAAYINGRGERLKLLLNQQDPAKLGRQMVYYDYLNRARNERIQTVIAHLAEIIRLDQELAKIAARLAELAADAKTEVAEQAEARIERAAVLASIRARISKRGDQITRLESEERALGNLIRDLQSVMRDFPVQGEQPFTAMRGKLGWPVNGRLGNDYGQQRAGGNIRWNGVVVEADRGAPVRAVARGRVSYADWLPGLGLLVILDHGGGYMSLYGHNDTINRDVGEWVQPGDIIATVGESGGRRSPALYFEIRNGARPENPHRWFGKALKPR
ncbi:MAG: peptidoglycan DD-metalloendopeptidase family protein [Gammaproteobacteria bacterium]|nr:peptidoglycan DD-metalloendopeptidase family protein [Gammaproteobacteria bacterium]